MQSRWHALMLGWLLAAPSYRVMEPVVCRSAYSTCLTCTFRAALERTSSKEMRARRAAVAARASSTRTFYRSSARCYSPVGSYIGACAPLRPLSAERGGGGQHHTHVRSRRWYLCLRIGRVVVVMLSARGSSPTAGPRVLVCAWVLVLIHINPLPTLLLFSYSSRVIRFTGP